MVLDKNDRRKLQQTPYCEQCIKEGKLSSSYTVINGEVLCSACVWWLLNKGRVYRSLYVVGGLILLTVINVLLFIL
jgi:hypothetical protein